MTNSVRAARSPRRACQPTEIVPQQALVKAAAAVGATVFIVLVAQLVARVPGAAILLTAPALVILASTAGLLPTGRRWPGSETAR